MLLFLIFDNSFWSMKQHLKKKIKKVTKTEEDFFPKQKQIRIFGDD